MNSTVRGGSRGGGGPGVRIPPPFWGTTKLHKERKNVAHMRAEMPRFSTEQLPGSPLSEILYPPLTVMHSMHFSCIISNISETKRKV